MAPLVDVARRPEDDSGGAAQPDGAAAPAQLLRAALAGDAGSSKPSMVEVPGIEPGSSVALPGLLRAQLTVPLLGPSDHVSESVWRAQSGLISPYGPPDGIRLASLLADAGELGRRQSQTDEYRYPPQAARRY